MKWLRCLWAGRHDPRRISALGGFKCQVCERVEADLDAFDPSVPQGYVDMMATKYTRRHGSIERVQRW